MLRNVVFILVMMTAGRVIAQRSSDFVFASPSGNFVMLSTDGKSFAGTIPKGYTIERANKGGGAYARLGVFQPVQTYAQFLDLVGPEMAAEFRGFIRAKTDADVVKFFNTNHASKDFGFYILDINFLRATGLVYLDAMPVEKTTQYDYKLVGPTGQTIRQQAAVAFNRNTLPRGQVKRILTTDSLVSIRWEFPDFNSKMPLLARIYRQDDGEGKFIAEPVKTTLNREKGKASAFYEQRNTPEHLINYYIVATDLLGNEGLPSDTATAITIDFKKIPGVQDIIVRDTLQGLLSTWKQLPAKPYYTCIQILRSRDARNSFIVLDTVAALATSYLDEQVLPNVAYFYKFRPVVYKLSGWDEIIATTVHGTRGSSKNPPLAPKNLAAAKEGRDIRLTWDHNMELDIFAYYVMRGTSASNMEIVSPAVKDTTWLDSSIGLSGRTNYVYSVVGVNNNQLQSAPSTATGISPARGEFIEAPAGITIRSSDKKFLVSWDDVGRKDNAVAGYILYRKRATDKDFTAVVDKLIDKPWYEDASLQSNTDYVYSVSAVDRFGYESERSPDARFRYTERVAPPTALYVRKLSTGVEVSWPRNNSASITGYTIWRKTGNTFARIGTAKPTELLFLDKKYVPNQLNVYSISITTAGGESGNSIEKSVFVER